MAENTPAEASAVDQRPKKAMPEGRRFKPGTSPCPGGRAGKLKRMRADLTDKLTTHLGRPLLAQELELVEQLVTAKMLKPSTVTDTLRQAGLVARLTSRLYGTKPDTAKPLLPSSPIPSGDDLLARSRARMATT